MGSSVAGAVDSTTAGSGAVAGAGWAAGSGGFGPPATGDEPGSTELATDSVGSGWSAAESVWPSELSLDGGLADDPDADGVVVVAEDVTSIVDVVDDRIGDADGAPPDGNR